MSENLKLICLDVDGTLVGASREVHPRVWEAAAKARAAGLQLAICTGRPAMGQTREFAETLDNQGWHIFQGGASLLNLASGKTLSRLLPAEPLQALLDQRQRFGWVLELYSDTDYVCNQVLDQSEAARLAVAHAELLALPYETRAFDSLQGEIVRAQWVVTEAMLPEVLAAAPAGVLYASATSPSVPGVHFVSVTAPQTDKCDAIRRLATEILGCGLEQTMMVGDGQNDISAMQMVGWPVAMGNGDPALKAVCRYHVGDVAEGGAAEAIEMALGL